MKLLSNYILLETEEQEKQTSSGILLNSDVTPFITSKVVSVGEGVMVDGKLVHLTVKVGDTVIVHRHSVVDFKIDEEKYLLGNEDGVIAIL